MSNVNILNLPTAVSLSGGESVPLVQGGVTKRAAANLFASISSLPEIADGTLLGNTSGSTAAPVATTQSQMLDTIGSTQGDILIRASSAWVRLAAGASGQFLKTQGAGSNPLWADVAAAAAGSSSQVQYNSSGALAASASLTFSGSTLKIGAPAATTGILQLTGSTSGTISIQPANIAGTWSLTLPASGGTSGYVLQTDGSGTTSWVAPSGIPAGSNTQIQFNSSGSFGASANLTFATSTLTVGLAGTATGTLALTGSTSGTISIQGQAAAGTYNFNLPTGAGTSGQPLLSGGGGATAMSFGTLGVAAGGTGLTSGTSGGVLAFTASGTLASSGALTSGAVVLGGGAGAAPNVSANLTFSSSTLSVGANAAALGAVKLYGSTSGDVTVKATAIAGTATVFQLPASNGSSGQYLQTDGSGATSWQSVTSSPGGSATQLQYNNSGSFAGASGLTTDGTNLTIGSSSTLLWSTDLILGRNAAATLRLGGVDAASPVAQTLTVQSVVTGTSNTAGTDFSIAGAKGTGAGAGGAIQFQIAPAGSSGSTPNSLVSIFKLAGTGHLLWNTDNTYDIGANGATRPRSLYLGGNIKGGSGVNAFGTEVMFRGDGGTDISGFWLSNQGAVGFGSTGDYTAPDTYIRRGGAAATVQLGKSDAASPVAQTLQVQSVSAGTLNTAGANWTFNGSRGTGTGVGGDLVFKTAAASGSGTSQNSLAEVFRIRNDGYIGFGTHSALAAETVTGYITVKDTAGNTRKVAVVS